MKFVFWAVGTVLAVVATYEIYAALSISTAVAVGAETVANNQLMEIQIANLLLGGFAALTCAICFGFGSTIDAIERSRLRPPLD